MKVIPVNIMKNNVNGNVVQDVNTNFRGLWGKSKVSSARYFDNTQQVDYDIVNETKYYYPFKDETTSEINKVLRKNKSSSSNLSEAYGIFETGEVKTVTCEVKSKLPFTAQEFKEFMNNSLGSLKSKIIEKHIFEKKLHI